ncbi:MAG: Gfo/Idh/MocA family oxidoreductase [Planctomycetes bacterium]|nr:Gfo/Idh/MocA family oxidoreductase [Planctomycetota bacterium]
MKKIGFIDYYIDEWHANNYPAWIRKATKNHDVYLAWEEQTKEGGMSLDAWSEKQQVKAAESMEQVIEECDVLIVLAPSNPEVHERLAGPALRSGKPVYVDKPFAQDRKTGERMFALAEKNHTPMMSSSALRFGSVLQKTVNETHIGKPAQLAVAMGGGRSFWEYSIHQLEMLVMLMGTGARRVMQCGTTKANHMIIDYGSGRRACMTLSGGQGFQISAYYDEADPVVIPTMDDFWDGFIASLLKFFDSGIPSIPKAQTLEIVSLVETGVKALEIPDIWFPINA